jgi:zinc transport system permease protein
VNESTPGLGDLLANLPLFRDAILCALFAGLVLGFLGVYVVLRRMVFASAAISQGAAMGVALAFLFEILFTFGEHTARHIEGAEGELTLKAVAFDPIVWAVICALIVTLVLVADPQKLRLTRESVLGLAFLFTGAGAVIVGSKITQEAHDINAILFGSAVVVREIDLYMVTGAAVLVLALQTWFLRSTVFASYDPVGARVAGLPVRRLNTLLFICLGVTVALATRALGALPVFGFSVLPAMAALAMTNRLGVVFILASVIGGVCGVAGYAIAFVLQLPVGATQTATMVAVLLVVIAVRAVAGKKGAVT